MSEANQQVKQLNESMKQAQELADALYEAAGKASGQARNAALNLAGLYQGVAKQQAEILAIEEKINDLVLEEVKAAEALKNATADQKAEAKKILDLKREDLNATLEIKAKAYDILNQTQQTIGSLIKQKGVWSEIKGLIGQNVIKLAGYVGGTKAILDGLKGVAKAAQDVADIQIQNGTFLGMSGNLSQDFVDAAATIKNFTVNMSQAKVALAGLGITGEETAAAFKDFSVLTTVADRQEKMTVAAGALSKVLGVSLGDATEYMIEQQQRYNRSAESSAVVLMDVYESTRKLNEGMSRTIMRGRDVTKILFDISRESKAVTQDQGYLSKMVQNNMVTLQAQGKSYKESLDSVSLYTKKLTTEAPDWAKIMSARELGKQLKELGKGTPLGKQLEEEIKAASPALLERIKKLQKDVEAGLVTPLTAERTMQEWLSESKVGMNAMQKSMSDLINRMGAAAPQAIQEIYGVSFSEALNLIDQNKIWENQTKQAKRMVNATSEEWDKLLAEFNEGRLNPLKLSDADKKALSDVNNDKIRASFLENLNLEKQKEIAKQQEEVTKNAAANRIKELQTRINELNSLGASDSLIKPLVDELKGLTEDNSGILSTVAGTIEKQTKALLGVLGGGMYSQIQELIASPLVQVAGGLAALGILAAQGSAHTTLLATIAANTGKGDLDLKGAGKLGKLGKLGKIGIGAGKSLLRFGRGFGGVALAAGIQGYDSYSSYQEAKEKGASQEELDKLKVKGTASTVSAGVGALAGAKAGAAMGALGGPVGVAIGGLIGAAVLGYLGPKVSDFVTDKTYKALDDKQTNTQVMNTPVTNVPNAAAAAVANAPTSKVLNGNGNEGIAPRVGQLFETSNGVNIIFPEMIIPVAEALAKNLMALERRTVS